MKIRISNNSEIVIEANQSKEGDYEAAKKVAEIMAQDDSIDIAAEEEGEFIHLCAVWNHYQKAELMDAYKVAKAAL